MGLVVPRHLRISAAGACFGAAALVVACRTTPSPHEGTTSSPSDHPNLVMHGQDSGAMSESNLDAALQAAAPAKDAGPAVVYGDPMKLHRETREELASLFSIKEFTEAEKKTIQPDAFIRAMFNPDGPSHANQGNKAIAQHSVSREQCLEGLKDVVIQTPEQKAKCGAENMVPVWVKGKDAWFCIDVFEFPNKACELPMVWTQPPLAKKVCELQGKRLCSDIEWNLACRGDPEGGDDWRYAYGNKLDLEICHTNLRHRTACVVQNAGTTWKTCSTDTEPSGAFPKCRSRFGVFDQHGNVAEVMMRREGDKVFTQLKGSAWFYVELAKEPNEPVPATTTNKTGAYADNCNFDPRWHVEQLDQAMHVNYHLGFRCCKSIP
jgi:formylglycine-generating enzyme required for sulfatase activity